MSPAPEVEHASPPGTAEPPPAAEPQPPVQPHATGALLEFAPEEGDDPRLLDDSRRIHRRPRAARAARRVHRMPRASRGIWILAAALLAGQAWLIGAWWTAARPTIVVVAQPPLGPAGGAPPAAGESTQAAPMASPKASPAEAASSTSASAGTVSKTATVPTGPVVAEVPRTTVTRRPAGRPGAPVAGQEGVVVLPPTGGAPAVAPPGLRNPEVRLVESPGAASGPAQPAPTDLSGWWSATASADIATSTADRSSSAAYRLLLDQQGARVVGSGVQWAAGGRPLEPDARRTVFVEGAIVGGDVRLTLREQPVASGPIVEHHLWLRSADDGSLVGRADSETGAPRTVVALRSVGRDRP